MAIKRIPASAFLQELPNLIRYGSPAVVTDFFASQPISRIIDAESAKELLSKHRFTIRDNYTNRNLELVRCYQRGVKKTRNPTTSSATFSDYLEMIARDPSSRAMIGEEPTPDSLMQRLDLSAIGVDTIVSGCGEFNLSRPAPPSTALSMVFVASSGCSSDLHFDGDGRDVLLYQGFGRKRVVLFHPQASPLLHPIANYSSVQLSRMDDNERAAFLAYVGGVEYVLMPGESLFMPAMIWHHFDYLDSSMSVSFRFGGVSDADARALMQTVHLDYFTQNIIVGTRNPLIAEPCRAAARRLRSAAGQSYPSTREKFRAIRQLAEECYQSTRLPGSRTYLPRVVEVADFLDGGLSGYYSQPPNGTAIRRGIWRLNEAMRDRLRRWGRRLAYWA